MKEQLTYFLRNSSEIENYSYVILFILVAVVLLKIIFNRYFKLVFTNDISNQVSENNMVVGMLLNLVFVVGLSFLVMPYTHFPKSILFLNPGIHFLLVFSTILAFFTALNILRSGYFIIMQNQESLLVFNKQKYFFSSWRIALVVLLIALTVFFPMDLDTHTELILILSSLGISFLIEWIYLFIIEKNKFNLNWYYKMLYLCNFEILPLLVMCKILFLNE